MRSIEQILREHGPQDLAQWFSAGVSRFVSGEEYTLCAALELRPAGLPSISRELAVLRRDTALRAAYALVKVPPETSTAGRCKELARVVRKFRSTTWAWARDYSEPPARLNSLQAALFTAFKATEDVPESDRQLRRICCDL